MERGEPRFLFHPRISPNVNLSTLPRHATSGNCENANHGPKDPWRSLFGGVGAKWACQIKQNGVRCRRNDHLESRRAWTPTTHIQKTSGHLAYITVTVVDIYNLQRIWNLADRIIPYPNIAEMAVTTCGGIQNHHSDKLSA